MTIKNVSGEARYFGFGRGVRGSTLANNATRTVPDNDPFVAGKVAEYVAAGSIQVVSAVTVTGVSTPAFGYIQANGAVADNDTVTIGTTVFEFENDPGAAVLGEYQANLTSEDNLWAGDGAAAVTAAGTLRTAINNTTATHGFVADPAIEYATGKYIIPLRRASGSPTAGTVALAVSGTNLAVSGAAVVAGVSVVAAAKSATKSAVPTADDVTNNSLLFVTGLTTISTVEIHVRVTATGAPKAWDGEYYVNGGNVVVTNTGGSVDFAETDTVTITVTGV